ncbi:MAG: hypothetical protein ACN6O5_16575 [Achromobacter sp.]|uniref:hypothetical protein n=1 Tax=unclassified Achromobacter TaxID=2626865 RepID=UPI0012E3B4C2|nr:hypothetical protein [Achromobacter sp. Root565]
MNSLLTTAEAFRAMLIFVDRYYKRGGRQSEDIATLLSGISPTIWADGNTNDPAQWGDWLAAVEASKNHHLAEDTYQISLREFSNRGPSKAAQNIAASIANKLARTMLKRCTEKYPYQCEKFGEMCFAEPRDAYGK